MNQVWRWWQGGGTVAVRGSGPLLASGGKQWQVVVMCDGEKGQERGGKGQERGEKNQERGEKDQEHGEKNQERGEKNQERGEKGQERGGTDQMSEKRDSMDDVMPTGEKVWENLSHKVV
ncbi:hypothetical protein Pmani_023530 [Petrolisthes manimaculis]|uniref:Uncharacterized protein n=1 Tax=Petrolisthes manimaculis TaxID=1843537 RepID=A0AAE1PBL3_9EUCA|nr:hypothetical protein Pmani_023530 [Petrolisthes manimaculis]